MTDNESQGTNVADPDSGDTNRGGPGTWGAGTRGTDAGLSRTLAEYLDGFPDGVLPIVETGHPVLRTVTAPYTGQLGDVLPRLLDAMRATMLAAPGVGLAAPQIGVGLAIAVIEDAGTGDEDEQAALARERSDLPFQVLINPRVTPVGQDRVSFFEGCLSVPGLQGVVARSRRVHLEASDGQRAGIDRVLTGWPARIVQHETDHLNGRLFLDVVETRSITTNANHGRFWAHEARPEDAARVLGF